MTQWVRLCSAGEAPPPGQVMETEAQGRHVCLANLGGQLLALDNLCPHRQGPLGQGWIEDSAVVCPWHSWAFDLHTGQAVYPAGEKVDAIPVRIEGDEVQLLLSSVISAV